MKNKHYCVKIETGISLIGRFCCYNGVFFNDWHDNSIFIGGTKKIIGPNEKVFGDKGYTEEECVSPIKQYKKLGIFLTPEQELFNQWIVSNRAVVENMNGFLKKWGILVLFKGKKLEFLIRSFVLIANLINQENFE